MRKRILLMTLIAVFAISFSACGGSDQKTDTQSSGSSSAGLEWPSSYMSSLPAPDSKISSIEKLNGTDSIAKDDTTTPPTSVNVVMNEMTNKEALAYYDKLKSAGFTINTDEKDSDKILLVGTLNDADKNPFLFGYSTADEMGNVSITILKEVTSTGSSDSVSGDQWPSNLLGDLPKPEYQTVTYKKGETGSDFEGSVQVELTGMSDGDKYIKDLEAYGYSSLTNMKIGEAVNFIGQKDDDSTTVQVTYNDTTKECSIIYGSGK